MRRPIIAGNWKMYKTVAESVAFVQELLPKIETYLAIDKVVCPNFMAIPTVSEVLKDSPLKVGAQTLHWKQEGAFTSQTSGEMLKGYIDFVIIGHSENRAYLAETDETVNKKLHAALQYGFTPIVAIGETKDELEAHLTTEVLHKQLQGALANIDAHAASTIILAYEPIWAIGTGLNAKPEDANRVIGEVIRPTIATLFGEETAQAMRIQYGGSVNPSNMLAYMQQPEIDGALVGGASLKVDDFTQLIKQTAEAKGL